MFMDFLFHRPSSVSCVLAVREDDSGDVADIPENVWSQLTLAVEDERHTVSLSYISPKSTGSTASSLSSLVCWARLNKTVSEDLEQYTADCYMAGSGRQSNSAQGLDKGAWEYPRPGGLVSDSLWTYPSDCCCKLGYSLGGHCVCAI